ncbi:MAG: hypothetical protein ABIZ70_00360 [Gemmatimonadales bacterium]
MKRRLALCVVLAAAAACSALPATGDGIVALEIRFSPPLTLRLGQTLTLPARAVNQQGDSVAAEIRWGTPDTAAVAVDSVTGAILARLGTGTARVQAHVGTLHSDLISITLQP